MASQATIAQPLHQVTPPDPPCAGQFDPVAVDVSGFQLPAPVTPTGKAFGPTGSNPMTIDETADAGDERLLDLERQRFEAKARRLNAVADGPEDERLYDVIAARIPVYMDTMLTWIATFDKPRSMLRLQIGGHQ